MVLINGKIITVDPDDTIVEAVALIDNKITALGSTAEIKKLTGPETKVIDLKGKTAMPGIIDSHTHPSLIAARNLEVNCRAPPIKNIAEILKELDFQSTDYVDKTTSEKIGNLLGVEVIVTGSFDLNDRDIKFWTDTEKEWNLENQDRRLRLEQMVAAQTRGEVIARTDRQYRMKRLQELRDAYDEAPPPGSLYLRLYEVGTSRIVDSVQVEGETETELLKRAVSKLARGPDKIPWTGKIADVEGDTVYINAGKNVGIQKGDEFTVFSIGREITDPESGNIIGYKEQKVGLVVVDTVQNKISRAKVARGMGMIKEGDKIQAKKPVPHTP